MGGWLSISLHELAHGLVATWGGDTTLKGKGYLGLNPFKYSERLISLALPLVFWSLGGFPIPGSPLFLSPHLLRSRAWRSAAAAAGLAMTGGLAIAFSLPFILGLNLQGWLGAGLALLASWALTVLFLNLLPFPGLDSYSILEPWLPAAFQKASRRIKPFGAALLVGIVIAPESSSQFAEYSRALAGGLGIPTELVLSGFEEFTPARLLLILVLVIFAFGYAQRNLQEKQGAPSPEQLSQEEHRLTLQRKANQAKLEQEPHNYGALVDQGNVLMKQRSYAKAVEHYSQALEHYPEDANFWHQRGFAKARQQKFAEALPDYEQSLQYRPKDYNTLHIKADALLMLKRNEEAVETFTQVLRHHPNDAHIWYDKGWVLQQLDRDEEALKAYQKALKIDDEDEKHWTMVAHTHDKLEQPAERDRILAKGLKRLPESFHLWDFKLNLTLNQKDYVGVLELCDVCEPFMPKEDDSTVPVSRAIALTKLGRYTEAKAAYEQALEQEPGDPWHLLNRAIILHEMLRPDDALADIDKLLKEKPDDSNYQEFKAMFLFGAKRYKEALSIYGNLLQDEALKDDERARLLTSKGYSLRKLEDYDDAMADYEKALALQPDHSQAWVKRGELHGTLGQQDLALADLDRAIELEADSAVLWRTRIYALYDMGLYGKALDGCEQALALGSNVSLWIEKARCHLALQNLAQAQEALTTAQSLDAPTTERIVADKPDLAELWQSFQGDAAVSEKSTAI